MGYFSYRYIKYYERLLQKINGLTKYPRPNIPTHVYVCVQHKHQFVQYHLVIWNCITF